MTQVLIVEDEYVTAKTLSAMLKELGYQVSGIASSGEEAIAGMASGLPDVVLMDIKLNGKMDGIEAAQQISDAHDIPVLYATAYADDAMLARAKLTRPFGYIVKPFSKAELHSNIEMALYKHALDKQMRDSLHGLIHGLTRLVLLRDPSLDGQQLKTSLLAEAIAREMKLDSEQITAARLGGLLHAIGLIGMPFNILDMENSQTTSQRKYFQTYPEQGYQILQPINFPWPLADIVRQHREKLDGSGYPAGLKDEQIIPAARIVAVACQVAWSSVKSGNVEQALAEIEQGKGKQYDASAVDACLKLFREQRFAFTDEGMV